MCNFIGEAQKPMAELLWHIETTSGTDPLWFDGLRKLCNGCPACMLAAMMQTKMEPQDWPNFDYKTEMAIVFAHYNDQRCVEPPYVWP